MKTSLTVSLKISPVGDSTWAVPATSTNGVHIQRFYSTCNLPKRYSRVEADAP
jgi:hypothetical protein